jgi:hypothetical protein
MRIESQRRLSRGLASVARSRVNDEKERDDDQAEKNCVYIVVCFFVPSKQTSKRDVGRFQDL